MLRHTFSFTNHFRRSILQRHIHSATVTQHHSHSQILSEPYQRFLKGASQLVPSSRITTDPLRTLVYGTDASFYRLIPKIVVDVESEHQVQQLILLARQCNTPITFRAAGTSLSGQACTDSILVRLVPSKWSKCQVHGNDASSIVLQSGVIGGNANAVLKKYGKKIGPDPSSIDACMVGGIIANNSSGMCCGTRDNSYNTLEGLRMVLSDGTVLDTTSAESRFNFANTHSSILSALSDLSQRVRHNPALLAAITRKYKIKNTTGYSINALVDYDDPIDILSHLMVGSEGTLGFISEVKLRTLNDLRHKATSLLLFPDLVSACDAVSPLIDSNAANVVELMDTTCLRSAPHRRVPTEVPEGMSALLIESQGVTQEELKERCSLINKALGSGQKVRVEFTEDAAEAGELWTLRKGLLTTVGALRSPKSSILLEDVAVPTSQLTPFTVDLKKLMFGHGYDARIFGHALDGNLHVLAEQSFHTQTERDRYKHMMDDLCSLVVHKYDGSLKAEHGTGRNIAPFVEMEWGKSGYEVMKEIKNILDPGNLLSPGVIITNNPLLHVENLKDLPVASPIVDKCIECGYCERNCPSRELTVTPRQRIVGWREIQRLRQLLADSPVKDPEMLLRLSLLEDSYRYDGDATCAADGMCSLRCPVFINTGELIKEIRGSERSEQHKRVASLVANHFGVATKLMGGGLMMAQMVGSIVGERFIQGTTKMISKVLGYPLPQWNKKIPAPVRSQVLKTLIAKSDRARIIDTNTESKSAEKVVYFPCCSNRVLGGKYGEGGVIEKAVSVLEKAGYDVIVPRNLEQLCCGMPFASNGFPATSLAKHHELMDALSEASEGKHPILMDMSPCVLQTRMNSSKKSEGCGLNLAVDSIPERVYEPVAFATRYLLPRLEISPDKLEPSVAVHAPCSTKRMSRLEPFKREKPLEDQLIDIAKACAHNVVVSDVPCCGMAGDKGLAFPELAHAAVSISRTLNDPRVSPPPEGFSNSTTCEIGLSANSKVDFRSIFHLLDRVSSPCSPSSREKFLTTTRK